VNRFSPEHKGSFVLVLVLQPVSGDFLSLESHLRQQLPKSKCQQVASATDLTKTLAQSGGDVILWDYHVSGLNFLDEMRPIQKHYPELPILLFSDRLGEETAISLLKSGVTDIIHKHQLSHLVPAIERALRETVEKQARLHQDKILQASEMRLKMAQEIAHLGAWDLDLQNNSLYWSDEVYRMFGLAPQEFAATYEAFLDGVHPEDRDKVNHAYSASIANNQDTYQVTHRIIRKSDQKVLYVHERCQHFRDPSGNIVRSIGIVHDITEIQEYQNQLQNSLKEKEVLLKEVHHRVKNNMQVICSLLSLQAKSIPDTKTRELFDKAQGRVMSMAIIHETLYQSNNFAEIEFGNYLEKLTRRIGETYPHERIDIELDTEPIAMNLTTAIPCGLIINELLSNSIKHAFPNQRSGQIRISLKNQENGSPCLRVSDNGVGLPESLTKGDSPSLGLQLIRVLSNQVNGTIVFSQTNGTTATLTLPPLQKH